MTHVELEPMRLRTPHLKNRFVVRVTYRRDDDIAHTWPSSTERRSRSR